MTGEGRNLRNKSAESAAKQLQLDIPRFSRGDARIPSLTRLTPTRESSSLSSSELGADPMDSPKNGRGFLPENSQVAPPGHFTELGRVPWPGGWEGALPVPKFRRNVPMDERSWCRSHGSHCGSGTGEIAQFPFPRKKWGGIGAVSAPRVCPSSSEQSPRREAIAEVRKSNNKNYKKK